MKTKLLALLFCAIAANAQYAPSASGSATAAAEINSKPALQTGPATPTMSCTAGKDFYFDTAAFALYVCTTTNNWHLSPGSTSNVPEGSNLYYTNARVLGAMAGLYEVPLTFSAPFTRTTNTLTLNMWGTGSRPVAASALGTSGNCVQWTAAGIGDAGSPCGSGGGGADALGYYFTSRATNAPANAVNLGLLTTGLLKISISGGVATASTAVSGTDFQGPISTGISSQYFRGDLSLATFPTNLSSFTNGPGYLTANQTITVSSDCSGTGTTGIALTCSKTGGVAFAASATTDATNASNIGSGTLPAARLPNPSASTLGGVQSAAAQAGKVIDSISTSGVPNVRALTSADHVSGVNAQTGTTYTVVDGDRGKLVTMTNAASIAVTLPQAGASSTFLAGWSADFQNRGAGTVTITPTTSTIDGAATLSLNTAQGLRIFSDGSNYFTQRGSPTGVNALSVSGSIVGTGTLNMPVTGLSCGKLVLGYASLTSGSSSQEIPLFVIPAGWRIDMVRMNPATGFTYSSVGTTLTASLQQQGNSGSPDLVPASSIMSGSTFLDVIPANPNISGHTVSVNIVGDTTFTHLNAGSLEVTYCGHVVL